ncbi:MAG: GNAT family protein [Bryobacteraceae bacterium]|nr:GNAT family protein [Bryobacteraceae bacterium]
MGLEPVILEGQYVRLVPLELSHAEALFEAGADPEVWRYSCLKIATLEQMRAYLAGALDEQSRGVSLPFTTCDKSTGRPIGTTRYGSIAMEHKRLEIGWTFIGPAWQRTPINTEAKYLMFRHAFEVLGVNRVELKTNALNFRSRNAMLRVGAKEEGTLRSHMVNGDGTIRDTVYFSVISGEWPGVKAALEEKLARPWEKSAARSRAADAESMT